MKNTNNSERFLQEQNTQYRHLIESMLDFFQVIPQSSSTFKSYKTKLEVFEKHYVMINKQKGVRDLAHRLRDKRFQLV